MEYLYFPESIFTLLQTRTSWGQDVEHVVDGVSHSSVGQEDYCQEDTNTHTVTQMTSQSTKHHTVAKRVQNRLKIRKMRKLKINCACGPNLYIFSQQLLSEMVCFPTLVFFLLLSTREGKPPCDIMWHHMTHMTSYWKWYNCIYIYIYSTVITNCLVSHTRLNIQCPITEWGVLCANSWNSVEKV